VFGRNWILVGIPGCPGPPPTWRGPLLAFQSDPWRAPHDPIDPGGPISPMGPEGVVTDQMARRWALVSSSMPRKAGSIVKSAARPQRETADGIGAKIIQLSAAVRKRTGSSSPLRAAAMIRSATTLRTIGSPPMS
jgi:hypothetical protein